MSSAYISNSGDAEGHLSLLTARMIPLEILTFHPEIQKTLDEVEKKGWKYLYIETIATSRAEITLVKSRFRIVRSPRKLADDGHSIEAADNVVELSIGRELPEIKAIPEVRLFRVNICSKSFPRAATVDLSKLEVTYLHDPFWK